jgi:2,4-dienoyl-CoA reductase-like NADH-dependent reductase (Old Yellow Enzyme family)
MRFDLVESHGDTFEKRQRFGLEVVVEVKKAVGNFPMGYRFLDDDWLPDGLKLEESSVFARAFSDLPSFL